MLRILHAFRDTQRGMEPGCKAIGGTPAGDLYTCLLYTSDAADERSSVDLGGRRILKKKTNENVQGWSDFKGDDRIYIQGGYQQTDKK